MKKMGSGFTLMELMIVIAIIMILSGAIVARIGTGSEKAKIAKATAEMNEIASACRAFNLDTGVWPGDKADLLSNTNTTGYNEQGTAAQAYTSGGKWRGPYLEAITWPTDPWTVNYVYTPTAGTTGNISVSSSNSFANNSVLVHRFGA